jgi:cardiolipin synthase
VDDAIAIIGSSNMDIRSFQLNAEITLVFYDPGLTARLCRHQHRYLANCETLSLEGWQERRLVAKTLQNLARLVSPLL